MPLHEPRTWTQKLKITSMSKLCKISPSHLFVPTTTTSLHYPTSTCLPLPQGSASQLYPIKVSAFSLPASSFPAHSAYITDIPHLFAVPIPLSHLCSSCSVWPQLFLLSGSLLLALSLLWVFILVSFLAPCPTWPYFLAPVCFLAPPASPWPPSLV